MPGQSRSKNGVASLARSRSKNGVASLARSRSKNGVASLAYGAGHPRLGALQDFRDINASMTHTVVKVGCIGHQKPGASPVRVRADGRLTCAVTNVMTRDRLAIEFLLSHKALSARRRSLSPHP